MKKTFLAFALILLTGGAAFGQTQTIALANGTGGNSGTYAATSTFSLRTSVTFAGYNSNGLSYWLQVPTALAPYLTITAAQYSTFTNVTQPNYPKTFTDSSGASAGFLSDKQGTLSGDLGATTAGADITPGTYLVTTLTLALNGAPQGTYQLGTTTVSPKTSEVGDSNFVSHNVAAATYLITVVPEPSSWALLAAGGGLLWVSIRWRRRTV